MSNANRQVYLAIDESVLMAYKIPNFEEFAITKEGKVYNIKKNKLVHSYIGIDDYEHIILFCRGKKYRKRVHRLMGKTFLGNPQVVNHVDGNKHNNRLENLERSTHRENILHAQKQTGSVPTVKVRLLVTNTQSNESVVCKSMRHAEKVTGVDRHRIKTFLNGTHKNYTIWEFKYL